MSAEPFSLSDAQADWFLREVKRCREIGMPIGCCEEWPECSHVLAWVDDGMPDHFEGNIGANIAGGRHSAADAAERRVVALTEALTMVKRIAVNGVGPDTSPEEALATIVAYIGKRLDRAALAGSAADAAEQAE